jgi:two-component system, chemotaxis family, protein-glutamate methylesterase/glutaminase
VLLAVHLHKSDRGRFAAHLDDRIAMRAREAEDKMQATPACVHVAPADYHLLVEHDGSLSLSVDPKVNWSRPSIDVLFETAARAYADGLIGVILSGANDDGAQGMRLIRDLGGLCLAQDPATAQSPTMPQAAIDRADIQLVLSPEDLGRHLLELAGRPDGSEERDR